MFVICTANAGDLLPELACDDGKVCPLTFVLSKTMLFNLGMTMSFNQLMNWLSLFGRQYYYRLHVSGHCPSEDLQEILSAAAARCVVPVHTRHPEEFKRMHPNVLSESQEGRPIPIH